MCLLYHGTYCYLKRKDRGNKSNDNKDNVQTTHANPYVINDTQPHSEQIASSK
jgi:hypothetical protein